jgi:putative transposase
MLRRGRGPTELRVTGTTFAPDAIAAARQANAPNRLWLADLGIAPTDRGRLYFGFVLDCYSRRCLGWWPRSELQPELLTRALQMAIAGRWPTAALALDPDRQAAPVAVVLAKRCRAAHIDEPRRARASAAEAALGDAFLAGLRRELLADARWPTQAEARTAIGAWIEGTYNLKLAHTMGSHMTPDGLFRLPL